MSGFDDALWQWQAVAMGMRFLILCALLWPLNALADTRELTVSTLDGRVLAFQVTLADTPERQQRGLMFVKSMPPQHGMLFPKNPPRIAHFWMRNTLIPLDLVFILPGGMIGQIVTRMDTQSDRRTSSLEKVSAVLEINANEAKQLKIGVGDIVSMPGVQF